jgi:hypothetical protein
MKQLVYLSLLIVIYTCSCSSSWLGSAVMGAVPVEDVLQLYSPHYHLPGAGFVPVVPSPRAGEPVIPADRIPDKELNKKVLRLEKKERLTEAENTALRHKNHIIILTGVVLLLLIALLMLVWYLIKQKQIRLSVESRNRLLETEKKLISDSQEALANHNFVTEQELLNKQLVLSFFRQVSAQNLEMKNFLSDLKANPYIIENKALHARITKECENYHHNTKISNGVLLSDDKLMTLTGISKADAEKLNKSEKMILLLMAIHVDNPEIAVLFNTSTDSIRNRKSQLKKKIEQNNIHLNEPLKGFK